MLSNPLASSTKTLGTRGDKLLGVSPLVLLDSFTTSSTSAVSLVSLVTLWQYAQGPCSRLSTAGGQRLGLLPQPLPPAPVRTAPGGPPAAAIAELPS